MGFGLLLIGYFAVYLMTMNPFGSIIRVAGYALITYASLKLKKYHRSFFYLTVASVLMMIVAVALLFSDLLRLLYDQMILERLWISEGQRTVIGYVDQGMSFLLQSAMLYGIRCIAKETEMRKIAVNAVRNFVFVCFYYLVYLVSFLPFQGVRDTQMELGIIAWVSYFAWLFLNVLLLISCYARLCDEDDVEMTRAPSKFQWVNDLRAEFDRRQEKAKRETAEYRKEKERKRRKNHDEANFEK